MRVVDLSKVASAVALPVVEAATRILIIAGMVELAGSSLEGLQVKAKELMLL